MGLEPLSRFGSDIVVVWDEDDAMSDVFLKAAYTGARALVIARKRDAATRCLRPFMATSCSGAARRPALAGHGRAGQTGREDDQGLGHLPHPEQHGQGCEGEPLTRGAALVDATRRIRAAAPMATIHVNTNGSRPDVLQRLVDAGLNSVRISVFSLDDTRFRAYYRPVGYGLDEVAECASVVAAGGGQVTINLLTFPGITDAPPEIDTLVRFIHRHGVHQVQLRSLNVDPQWLLDRIPQPTRGIGLRKFVRQLTERCPDLQLGNFTRRWPAIERQPVWASSR